MHKNMFLFCLLEVLSFIYPCFIVSHPFRAYRFMHKNLICKQNQFSSKCSILNPEHCQMKFLLLSPMIIWVNCSVIGLWIALALFVPSSVYFELKEWLIFLLLGVLKGKMKIFFFYLVFLYHLCKITIFK